MNQPVLGSGALFRRYPDTGLVERLVHVKNIGFKTQSLRVLACVEHQLHGQVQRLTQHGGAGAGPQCDGQSTRRQTQPQAPCQQGTVVERMQKGVHLTDSGMSGTHERYRQSSLG